MLSDMDVKDIELEVDEFLLSVMQEFQREYNSDMLALVAAMAVHNAPPEVLAQLPQDAVKKVQGMVKHG